jgi:hypothetical protein
LSSAETSADMAIRSIAVSANVFLPFITYITC